MMKRTLLLAAAFAAGIAATAAEKYDANWESLDKRPVPAWWTEAKFGIFIHWGPYSVPAFGPTTGPVWTCYAEWYNGRIGGTRPTKSFQEHHEKFYHNAPYANFAAEFKAENYDPKAWARLFKAAGAKYAVLTSKHHDGYALWPSPESPYYNSVAMGSGRDLAREFADAMAAEGLKRGFYYSVMEYENAAYRAAEKQGTLVEWSRRVNLPQMKELVEDYKADIIWPDGEWEHSDADWDSVNFLQWLFNESSMKDTVVVNDRWGKGCRGRHGGHYTTEYGNVEESGSEGAAYVHPWEECRGLGRSFGYNRYETVEHYATREKCVELLVSIVAGGGNLLLNVGPTADGRIPPIMEDRLLAMGEWLKVNGEAIYGTTKGPKSDAKARRYFTRKGDAVYAIAFGNAPVEVEWSAAKPEVTLLGSEEKVDFSVEGGKLVIRPTLAPPPGGYARVWRIAPAK